MQLRYSRITGNPKVKPVWCLEHDERENYSAIGKGLKAYELPNAPPSVGSGKARLICGSGVGVVFLGGCADVGDLFADP